MLLSTGSGRVRCRGRGGFDRSPRCILHPGPSERRMEAYWESHPTATCLPQSASRSCQRRCLPSSCMLRAHHIRSPAAETPQRTEHAVCTAAVQPLSCKVSSCICKFRLPRLFNVHKELSHGDLAGAVDKQAAECCARYILLARTNHFTLKTMSWRSKTKLTASACFRHFPVSCSAQSFGQHSH